MQDLMQHHKHTALFMTVSGVLVGVGKTISAKPLLLAIKLPKLSISPFILHRILYYVVSKNPLFYLHERNVQHAKMESLKLFPSCHLQQLPFL